MEVLHEARGELLPLSHQTSTEPCRKPAIGQGVDKKMVPRGSSQRTSRNAIETYLYNYKNVNLTSDVKQEEETR